VNPDIKVHTVISSELDYDHKTAMNLKLGEVNDEQLLAEVARRKLDIHDRITDSMVKETYSVGKVLGHGASGEVYAVTHKVTGKKFACKVVKKNANMNDAQSMSTEIEIMKRIRHRNIVSTYELYETPKCLWIILELVDGGDLYHFLANAEGYNEVIASRQMKQALAGIHYLHSLGVVHRDLKLDNILILGSVQACEVKIADFGLSALVHLDEDGYDAESSAKRKRYTHLTEVGRRTERVNKGRKPFHRKKSSVADIADLKSDAKCHAPLPPLHIRSVPVFILQKILSVQLVTCARIYICLNCSLQ